MLTTVSGSVLQLTLSAQCGPSQNSKSMYMNQTETSFAVTANVGKFYL